MIKVPTLWRRARRRVRVALALLTAAAMIGAVPGAPTASAHPLYSSKAFDPDETGWGSVHAYKPADFDKVFADYDRWGHLVVDLEVDTFEGDLRIGAQWQYNTDHRGYRVKPKLTAAELAHEREANEHRQGYRLVDLEIYQLNGVRTYGAVWVENLEKLTGDDQHELTYQQFLTYRDEQRRLGRLPVDFDIHQTAAGTRYNVIWVDNTENLDWRLESDLGEKDYLSAFENYGKAGLRQLSFDSVFGSTAGGASQRFGGIWVQNKNGRSWGANHDMSALQQDNLFHRNADLGFRPIFGGRYQTALGDVKYAQIWRANSDRPTWKHRQAVDDKVAAVMGNLPGISVSVTQNGKAVYQRGFGHADVANGVWMDSDHVLRTASVAKAVSGILTLRLEEQGFIDRTDTVASDVPGLPAQHVATTYEQLVSNQGCVRHYATGGPGVLVDSLMASVDFPTAGAAAPLFWNDVLVGGCTVGMTNFYSTHGYTLAAAGMEAATGTPVADLLRQQLSDPFGLTTLRQEEPLDFSVRRSKIYSGAVPVEVPRDQISWKTLGGGLETTPKDLTRLCSRLLAGSVLSAADVEYLWSGTGWGYAYGFGIGTQNKHRRVAKNGSQRGADSFLLIYPDDGIVIAVMANRQKVGGGTPPAEAIAEAIGALMIA